MRLTAAAVIFGLAGAAHADFFQIVSDGGFVEVDLNDDERVLEFETTVFDEVGPYGFTSVAGDLTQMFTKHPIMDDLSGSFVITGPNPEDQVVGEYAGVIFPDELNDGLVNATFAGTWELVETTGIYADLNEGNGQLSGSFFYEDEESGDFVLIIQGVLVPAPAGLAVLGLGGIAAFRRRR